MSDDDEAILAEVDGGPLLDHVEWYHELLRLALAERAELIPLEALAGGAPIVELPLLDADIHDVPGLIDLSHRLVGERNR